MGWYSRKWSLASPAMLLVMLLIFAAIGSINCNAYAQWKVVAPNAVPASSKFGAMQYKDGILWAGTTTLVFSSDFGSTWHPSSYSGPGILDISFANQRFGMIASQGDAYITRDGGQTWTAINALPATISSILCVDDKQIFALRWDDDKVYRSRDGGSSWQSTTVGSGIMTLTQASDGVLYVVTNYANPGIIHSSSDSGVTWKQRGGLVGEDCWSIVSDRCDPARLYVTTENINLNPWLSRLFASSDRGNTWTVGYSDPIEVAGSLATGGSAATAGTITQGILRTTDYGISWQNMGGPNGSQDNRGICMVNEDIAFALDRNGNIWGTINSGGDSIPVTHSGFLMAASPSLFDGDTLSCDSLNRSVFFKRSGCAPPSIVQCSVVGADSASFQTGALTYDSIPVTLFGTMPGSRHAQLVFLLDDGSRDTVELSGVVNIVPSTLKTDPATLFESDTVSCDSLTRSLLFRRGGCSPPSVSRVSIIGPDSASFETGILFSDSIAITLHGGHLGNQNAQLVLVLDDGSQDTVVLAGFVNTPVNALRASPATLFQTDSISCDSLTRTIRFSRSGCLPPSVSSWSILGVDSASFFASNLTKDSIEVTMRGIQQGDQNAVLVLNLDNGSSDTVALAGYANLIPNSLSFSTSDLKTNIIGGTVAVPITINGLLRPEDVDLVLHYDGTVDYLGSFSPAGATLDSAGEQSPGRSVLHISGASPGMVAGYAKFNVFNDSNVAAHATFDSMEVLTAISPCEYTLPEMATSTMLGPSGCGTDLLSRMVHLGAEPKFSVQPNPAQSAVSISSTVDLGKVTIILFDLLGAERSRWDENMKGNTPVVVPLPESDGVYSIVLNSAAGTFNLRVVRHR